MGKRIAITGGSGFIGTNLVQYFLDRKWTVLSLDARPPRNKAHTSCFCFVDLLDGRTLSDELVRFAPDYLVHLAARTDLDEAVGMEAYEANTTGVRNVIAAAAACPDLKRTIFASSMLVCRSGYRPEGEEDYCPSTVYGKSKVVSEQIIREAVLPFEWLIVRPTSIWGPWFGTPYREFFDYVLSGRFCHPGDRAGSCTFGYVGNTVYQIAELMEADIREVGGKVFYLGDKPPNNLSEWAHRIAGMAGKRVPHRLPYGVLMSVAKLGDLLKKAGVAAPLTTFRLRNMTTDNILDLDPIYRIAPRTPYSRDEGIRETLSWLEDEN